MSVFEKDDTNFGVNLIIPQKDGTIPLMRRANCFGAGTWALFGGKIKQGETIEAAAQREGEEECGIIIPRSAIEVVNLGQTINSRHMLQVGVVVHSYKGKIKIMEPDLCDKLSYFKEETLPGKLFLGTVGNIHKFYKNQNYVLDEHISQNAVRSSKKMPISISLIIVDNDDRILLTRNISGLDSSIWGLNKGQVEEGETIEEATARIVCETLGIFVSKEETIFNNFWMEIENEQNIMHIGIVVCHDVKEHILPKSGQEIKYIHRKSFNGSAAILADRNLKNYYNNKFYS